jgi:hypothetical protein
MSVQNITLGRISVPAITNSGVAPDKVVGGLPTSKTVGNRMPRPDGEAPEPDSHEMSPASQFMEKCCADETGPTTAEDEPVMPGAKDQWTDAKGLAADFEAGASQCKAPGLCSTQSVRDNVARSVTHT